MSDARLWWVRHGPTHARTMIGWTDLAADLSDTAALARLADHLPAAAPVISSDLARARATADALVGTRTRLPDDPGLREIHFGRWENLSFAEAEARDPALIKSFWTQPGAVRAPDGESWHDLSARVGAAADRLAGLGSDVIVVAHFGAILTQVQRARGVPATEVLGQPIDNLSLTVIERGAGSWRAGRVNQRL